MKATEAREKALSINSNRISTEYEHINGLIGEEVKDGKFKFDYDGSISTEVMNKLKEDGYELRYYQSGMNEYSTEIKW